MLLVHEFAIINGGCHSFDVIIISMYIIIHANDNTSHNCLKSTPVPIFIDHLQVAPYGSLPKGVIQ